MHGRRSQYGLVIAGSPLHQFYEAAQSDPNLVTLRNEIALTEARIAAQLEALVHQTRPKAEAGERLSNLVDLKRRLVEGQARVARDTFQTVALAHVVTFIAQVADLIRRYVSNPEEVAAVVRGLTDLLGPRTDTPALGGPGSSGQPPPGPGATDAADGG